MRVSSLVLIAILGISGVASADPLADRTTHVFGKGRGATSTMTRSDLGGGLTQTRQTVGQPGGRMSSLIHTDGRFAGHHFDQVIAQSTIGDITRTEMVTKARGRISIVSTVESRGAHPHKLTVERSQGVIGSLFNKVNVKITRQ